MIDGLLASRDIIVFDVGNVLVRFDPKHIAKQFFPAESYERLYAGVFESGLWPIIDTGLMSTGELAKMMCQAAHTDNPRDYLQVASLLDTFHLHERALSASKWLPELKAMGKKLYYLSNYSEPAFSRTFSRFPFFRLFDGGVVSAREHVCKPAPRIYQILCERYGFAPADALFVDDNQDNIKAASALGFAVWNYTDGMMETGED